MTKNFFFLFFQKIVGVVLGGGGVCKLLILTKLEISRQIFDKYSNKFYDTSLSGNRAVACGQTDRHDERIYNAVLRVVH